MKRNLITIQFIEDGLIILNQNELKEYSLKSVNNHQVINKELFIQEFSPIIESNKINNKIFTDNLNIIIDSSYSNFYLSNLEQLFKELSFNKIEFINILDIIKLNNNELLIELSTTSIKFITNTMLLNCNTYNNKYKSIISILLKEVLKNTQIKTIYIYGKHNLNKKNIEYIEKISNSKVYIYTQPNLIPIKLLI